MTQKLKFPNGFLWGAATAAHQIEGNNTNSDWWAWEHSTARIEQLRAKGLNPEDFQSGIACDSYNRFDEDFELAQHLNHNATRLSIEWARIEPKEGVFNEFAFEHYEKVLQSAKAHGLTTFVTLHHFSIPLWFRDKHAFEHKENIIYFTRYAEIAARRLAQYTDFWITINEPEIYSLTGYIQGIYPPHKKNIFTARSVANNLISAHNAVAPVIKRITGKPVSMAYHLSDLQPADTFGQVVASLGHYFANRYILERTIENCDFIGVNYYFHHHVGLFGARKHSHSGHDLTDLGWGIHPEGLERVLLFLRQYKKPIYITENGLADAKDVKREKYIKDHLCYMHKAIMAGADVRGYLHWSLIDNFEWQEGFSPRFGLIEIDRQDLLRRKVRFSATVYAEICKNNYLEVDGA